MRSSLLHEVMPQHTTEDVVIDQQLIFADSEFSNKRRQTRKEKLLGRMGALISWAHFEDIIEPHYPKAGNGHRPYPLSTMLRIHCMQQW